MTIFKNNQAKYNCIVCEKKYIYIEKTQEQIYYCHEIIPNKGVFSNTFENTYLKNVVIHQEIFGLGNLDLN